MDEVEEAVGGAVSEFITTYQVPLRIVLIIIVAILLHWVLRFALRRTVDRIVRGVKKAGGVTHTQEMSTSPNAKARAVQRTRTLGAVGRNVISWLIAIIAVCLILGELNFNLTALLASAGVVAAGLAFGAQNIVKDILNGVFMVFEDQVGVGDVVTIGEITGTVEDVGIRITQLRAIDGTLWFVRNGEILTLGNASQGWGRALIDVTVDSASDLELVERVTLEAAQGLLRSPDFARKISGAPEVWGVESAFGDRTTLRLAMRTRPEAQWEIQRALRSAIMSSFHAHDIKLAAELPKFPGGPA